MSIKIIVLGAVLFVLSGCGTALTLLQSDDVIVQDLVKRKTNCQSLPRAYSGVSYDFCVLDAEPSYTTGHSIRGSIPLIFIDVVMSGVVDTLVLPYTVYQQNQGGSLLLK